MSRHFFWLIPLTNLLVFLFLGLLLALVWLLWPRFGRWLGMRWLGPGALPALLVAGPEVYARPGLSWHGALPSNSPHSWSATRRASGGSSCAAFRCWPYRSGPGGWVIGRTGSSGPGIVAHTPPAVRRTSCSSCWIRSAPTGSASTDTRGRQPLRSNESPRKASGSTPRDQPRPGPSPRMGAFSPAACPMNSGPTGLHHWVRTFPRLPAILVPEVTRRPGCRQHPLLRVRHGPGRGLHPLRRLQPPADGRFPHGAAHRDACWDSSSSPRGSFPRWVERSGPHSGFRGDIRIQR